MLVYDDTIIIVCGILWERQNTSLFIPMYKSINCYVTRICTYICMYTTTDIKNISKS